VRRAAAVLAALGVLGALAPAATAGAPNRVTCKKATQHRVTACRQQAAARKAERRRRATAAPGVPGTAPAATTVRTAETGTAAPVPSAPAAPASPAVPACDPSPYLGTVAEDVDGVFRLRLRRTCVRAGTVTFELQNRDSQAHNLFAEAPGGTTRRVLPDVAGGDTASAQLLVTAGAWRLFCDIPGHEAMSRPLTVTV